MTRKEEIEQAARNFESIEYSSPYTNFIQGAEWADANPDEQAIAKYLYEKKGYPVDLNGNVPSFEDTMKDVEKYDNYKKKQMIEKVCEWLENHNDYQQVLDNGRGVRFDMTQCVFDLRKAMEE